MWTQHSGRAGGGTPYPSHSCACPSLKGAGTRGGGGLRSLLLSLLSDPSGCSDTLHSAAPPPSHRHCSTLSLTPLSVSVSRPALFLALCPLLALLSAFCIHRSQPRSRRVEGSALSAHTVTTLGTTAEEQTFSLRAFGSCSCWCCCRMDPRRCSSSSVAVAGAAAAAVTA